ncbi:protein TSSC4 [Ornithorhynchus anatinus]|uniref:protein TSSC4 n=1 Tax=Ornithorhynchus anatinus TaxID=9258 RepID=UPI0010A76E38|nr:protein TSSC4 [Ornithorhynchus anatinus]XP_028915119.1 protein TSSC4 [Ornithorhynchus anatinus]
MSGRRCSPPPAPRPPAPPSEEDPSPADEAGVDRPEPADGGAGDPEEDPESDPESDPEEDPGPAAPPPAPVRPFHLPGTSPSFSLRSRSVFDGLEGPAAGPPPAAVPDYVTHPERWTRYSLSDTPDATDRDNRAAALDFLDALRRRRGPGPPPSFDQDAASRGAGRIVFRRPGRAGPGGGDASRKRPARGDGPGGEPPGREEDEDEDPDPGDGGERARGPPSEDGTAACFHGNKRRSRGHFRVRAADEDDDA